MRSRGCVLGIGWIWLGGSGDVVFWYSEDREGDCVGNLMALGSADTDEDSIAYRYDVKNISGCCWQC